MRRPFISAERLFQAAVALAMLVSLPCGCERRPLMDPGEGARVRLVINTDNIQNVTCDVYNPDVPVPEFDLEMMHVLLYDESGERIVSEQYVSDHEGNEGDGKVFRSLIGVLPGEYRLLAHNFGTEAAVVEDWHSASSARVRSTAVPEKVSQVYNSRAGEDGTVIYEPEHVFVASEPVRIPYHEGVYTVTADAFSLVESWYVQIRVDGLRFVNGAQAFLSGMSSANFIASDSRVDDPQATVWFPMLKSTDKGEDVICAVFNTFGRIGGASNDLRITFGLRTRDGGLLMKEFDISHLFDTENARLHHWLLLDEVIEVEDPRGPEGDGGFDPSVGDWDEEHREIVI